MGCLITVLIRVVREVRTQAAVLYHRFDLFEIKLRKA